MPSSKNTSTPSTDESLVLIHGSPGNAQTWAGVVDALGDDAPETLFAPNFLENIGPAEPPGTADIAATLAKPWPDRSRAVTLVAHSYGANVALHLALGGDVRVDRMLLLEPVALNVLTVTGEAVAFADLQRAFAGYLAQVERGDENAVGTMVDIWFGPGAFAGMPPPVQDYLRSETQTNAVNVRATFEEHYEPDALAALSCPVVVAWGGASPAANRTLAEAIAAACGRGTAVAVDGATHAMPQTHAADIAELIRNLRLGAFD